MLKRESLRGPLYGLLSEALFWLGDLHGSLYYLNELENLLTESNSKLSRIIEIVRALSESHDKLEMNAELETFDEENRSEVLHIIKPSPCSTLNVVQDDFNQVLGEWTRNRRTVSY